MRRSIKPPSMEEIEWEKLNESIEILVKEIYEAAYNPGTIISFEDVLDDVKLFKSTYPYFYSYYRRTFYNVVTKLKTSGYFTKFKAGNRVMLKATELGRPEHVDFSYEPEIPIDAYREIFPRLKQAVISAVSALKAGDRITVIELLDSLHLPYSDRYEMRIKYSVYISGRLHYLTKKEILNKEERQRYKHGCGFIRTQGDYHPKTPRGG